LFIFSFKSYYKQSGVRVRIVKVPKKAQAMMRTKTKKTNQMVQMVDVKVEMAEKGQRLKICVATTATKRVI
jgi:hypothetical protein